MRQLLTQCYRQAHSSFAYNFRNSTFKSHKACDFEKYSFFFFHMLFTYFGTIKLNFIGIKIIIIIKNVEGRINILQYFKFNQDNFKN